MKHLKIGAILCAATAISTPALAQDNDGINPTSSIASVSEYVFRGTSLGDSSLQPVSYTHLTLPTILLV